MTETPIELIQARINSIRRELDWLDNNPKAHHPIYHETIKQCTMVELNFLETLLECIDKDKKPIILPISKEQEQMLSNLYKIGHEIQMLNIAGAEKQGRESCEYYKKKAFNILKEIIQMVEDNNK
jgi:hypothetical protein